MAVSCYIPITEVGEVSVELWVNPVGKTSADFGFAVRSADNTVLHAEGKRVSVRVDAKTHRPTPWGDDARRDMLALIPRRRNSRLGHHWPGYRADQAQGTTVRHFHEARVGLQDALMHHLQRRPWSNAEITA